MEFKATVHGAMAFVLRISRCMGCTPVHLQRTRNGYRTTLSYPIAYFGYAFFVLFCFVMGIGFTCHLYFYFERNPEMEFPILMTIDMSMCVILNAIVFLNSTTRTKYMIKHLNVIDKIRSKLIQDCDKQNPAEWKRIFIITSLILVFIINNLLSILKQYIFNWTISFGDFFNTFVHIMYFMFFLLTVQIILMIYEVYSVFKTAKVKLIEILYQTNETSSDLTLRNVRDLVNTYISTCNLVYKMNERDSMIIFFTTSVFVIHIIFNVLAIVNCLKAYYNKTSLICYYFLCFCSNIIKLFFMIEPFKVIIVESNEIQIVLSKIMYKLAPAGAASPWKWDLIYKQLCLTEPVFQPLGIFTLHRSLITKIVSFSTSYLIILIEHTGSQLFE